MSGGQRKENAAADLALIGAAQRVQHYEMFGYTTARNLAQQLRHSAIVALLSKPLAEGENADQLLNQVARSLMSVAKMPAAIERAPAEGRNRTQKDWFPAVPRHGNGFWRCWANAISLFA